MIRAALALAFVLLAACDEAGRSRTDRHSDAASACADLDFEGDRFTHCVADPASHVITMALGPANGEPWRGFDALQAAEPDRARRIAFAMNGGMFGEDGRPIGYYVEAGKRSHALNRGRGSGNFHLLPNGVFYGDDAQWAVRETGAFARSVSRRPRFGTQSGPMLVIAGRIHPRFSADGDSRYVRNAVGVDKQGRAHFVISDQPVSFGKFARLFRDRLQTPNALFLDGNVSALWDPATGRIDRTVPLGPLIVVENRANAATRKGAP